VDSAEVQEGAAADSVVVAVGPATVKGGPVVADVTVSVPDPKLNK